MREKQVPVDVVEMKGQCCGGHLAPAVSCALTAQQSPLGLTVSCCAVWLFSSQGPGLPTSVFTAGGAQAAPFLSQNTSKCLVTCKDMFSM
jgi:hypothetical protein